MRTLQQLMTPQKNAVRIITIVAVKKVMYRGRKPQPQPIQGQMDPSVTIVDHLQWWKRPSSLLYKTTEFVYSQ